MDIVDRLRGKEITHSNTPYAEIAKEAAAEITRLRKERDEARAALTSVRDAIVRADPYVLTCTLWMPDSMSETVVDFIDAALPTPEATK
jgi:hypothetical protein